MKQPAYTAQSRIDTPLGPLTAAATSRGLAGLWFDGQRHHPGPLDDEAIVRMFERVVDESRRLERITSHKDEE